MVVPLLVALGIGAVAGGVLGGVAGPKEVPLWQRVGLGATAGGTLGLGVGAALPAGAAVGGAGAGLGAGAGASGLGVGVAGTSGLGTTAGLTAITPAMIAAEGGTLAAGSLEAAALANAAPLAAGEYGALAPLQTTGVIGSGGGGGGASGAGGASITPGYQTSAAGSQTLNMPASSGAAEYGALAQAPAAGPAVPLSVSTENALQGAGQWIGNHKALLGTGFVGLGAMASDNAQDDDDDDDYKRNKWAEEGSAAWEGGSNSSSRNSGSGSVFAGSVSRYMESQDEDKRNPYARSYRESGSYSGGV